MVYNLHLKVHIIPLLVVEKLWVDKLAMLLRIGLKAWSHFCDF